MKFFKILASGLAAALAIGMASCGEADYTPEKPDYNSLKDVTVGMEDADLSFLETKGIVKVPVQVIGKRNGYVSVTCAVKEYGPNVAMEDVHYLLTSQTINVDTMDNVGYFEIKLVDDVDENEPRMFELSLVSAQGATISGIENTVVTIKDNDSDPYLKMAGVWYTKGYVDDTVEEREINIDVFDEGTAGYYKFYSITGLLLDGQSGPASIIADFDWNEATKEGSISIEYDQALPEYSHPSYGIGLGSLGWITGSGTIGGPGSAVYTWDSAANVMTLKSWPGDGQYPYPGADFAYFLEFEAGIMLYDDISGVYTISRDNR